MSIESVIPSNHPILCRPLLLLPSIIASIRTFSNELILHISWPKYWNFSFSFSISPSNEYSGLISFRFDWFDLCAVQETLKSLLQHLQLAQTLVHQVSDAIQPSHPLLFPSLPTFNLFQHQGLSNESVLRIWWPNIGVSASASVFPVNIQD